MKLPLLFAPEFSVAKLLPKTMNSSHYRFPALGQNYIEIPQEAFHGQGQCPLPSPGTPGSFLSLLQNGAKRGRAWGSRDAVTLP